MRKLLIILVGISCMMGIVSDSYGQFWRKKKKKTEVQTPSETKYDLLMKESRETHEGLITIHKFKKK